MDWDRRHGQAEMRTECPLWLEFSGLPEFLCKRVRKEAWAVFKKIVELDCAVNLEPGVVEISLDELALRTGFTADVIGRCVAALRKKKFLACFIPDNTEEKALIRITTPFKTPIPSQELKNKRSDIFPPGLDFFRYVDQPPPSVENDPILSEVVDLYFNAIGLKMNFFILDELCLMRQRFELSEVKKAFEAAKRHEIKSLRWVMRQLVAGMKKDGKRKKGRKKKGV